MEAASGITDITPYTLNMTNMTGSLSVQSPTKLLLNAQIVPVCEIVGGSQYNAIQAALNAITDTMPATIKLLDNITTEDEVDFYDQNIIFDLNGKNLIFGESVSLDNSVVDYTGAGDFKSIVNIQTTNDYYGFTAIDVYNGSTLKLMSVEVNVTGGTNGNVLGISCNDAPTVMVNGDVKVTYSGNYASGINVYNNSTVTVNGSITAADEGIYATTWGTDTVTVTVIGNVNAANGYGVEAYNNTAITINGSVIASGRGIYAANWGTGTAAVTVGGNINVNATDGDGWGVETYGSTAITVNGSVTASDIGIYANGNGYGTAAVTVNGYVNAANGYGVQAYDSTAITIDGKINAANYIQLNDSDYVAADGIPDTTKTGYLKYADSISTVWVGNKIIVYQITATAGTGGSISPSGTINIENGNNQTFTFAASSGYKISQVLIDGINNSTAVAAGNYTFTNVQANHTIAVSFTTSTDIAEATAEKMTIYPNPTNGQLIIAAPLSPPEGGKQAPSNSPSGGEQPTIEIYNVVGQVVFKSQLSKLSPETTIDVSHLSAGLYFLKVTTNKGTVTEKFVKE